MSLSTIFLLCLRPFTTDATCDLQDQSWLYHPLHTRPRCDNKALLGVIKQHTPSVASSTHQRERWVMFSNIPNIPNILLVAQHTRERWVMFPKFLLWIFIFLCRRPICSGPILGDAVWQSVKAILRLVGKRVGRLGRLARISTKVKISEEQIRSTFQF